MPALIEESETSKLPSLGLVELETVNIDHRRTDRQSGRSAILPSLRIDPTCRNASELGASENTRADSTSQAQETFKPTAPIIKLFKDQPRPRKLKMLQHWEGVVTKINGDEIEARIRDLTNESNPEEFVELDLHANFSQDDLPLLRQGSVFYWSIGIETSPAGQIRNVSEIRLKRSVVWSERKIQRLKERGSALYDFLLYGTDDAAKD